MFKERRVYSVKRKNNQPPKKRMMILVMKAVKKMEAEVKFFTSMNG